jgi:hypothetical protein
VPRSPFDLPNYDIAVGKRYGLRDDAPPISPGPLPPVVVVRSIVDRTIEFYDEAHPSNAFTLSTRDFREVFDPA